MVLPGWSAHVGARFYSTRKATVWGPAWKRRAWQSGLLVMLRINQGWPLVGTVCVPPQSHPTVTPLRSTAVCDRMGYRLVRLLAVVGHDVWPPLLATVDSPTSHRLGGSPLIFILRYRSFAGSCDETILRTPVAC